MKKHYLIFLTLIVGGLAGYFYLNTVKTTSLSSSGYFTPKQIWEKEYNNKKLNGESEKTDKPDEFTKYFKEITTKFAEKKNGYSLNYRVKEFNKAKSALKNQKTNHKYNPVWEQRGPANVGGRTRGIIADPDDATHNTWFAGAATGGVWKTTDGGKTWVCLTDGFPNLSANTLAMAESNHQVIYAGTGESFPGGTYLQGSGIFKTVDKGANWTQLTETANNEDFEYVNRLVVDPNNENIVVAATESGILKSIDGGTSWTKVYSSSTGIEDLNADPTDFSKVYATEHGVGVVKSTDSGDSWTLAIDGLEQGLRYELAISPVNTAKIYLSVNTNSDPVVYRSVDYGNTWIKFKKSGFGTDDYLGGQGEYDNIITAHPYNEDVAFLGGVNLWKVDFSDPGTITQSNPEILRLDQIGTKSFIDFVEFNNAVFADILGVGTQVDNNVTDTDFVSVEIRFGPGMTQKAHRFTVGGVGAGVPDADYIYKDYVDVPFEAWDVTNNKQLMVSFRDQEEDGKFDLELADNNDDTKAREYLFVNAIDYNGTTPSADIAKNGGHAFKQIYFLWPRLAEGATWDETNLPDSKVSITYDTLELQTGTSTNVTDAYGAISGNNTYNQSAGYGETAIPGVHPDHHNIVIVPISEAKDSFLIVNGNDGGLAISKNSGVTFNQLPNNYITTQFYGVAKKPNANEYIGGMQDNGTWRSPAGENASSSTKYLFQLGGDGFECIWNTSDDQKIIGSVYNNSFTRTLDGGQTWSSASSGITSNDGPFISRISTHKNTPDNLFAVGANGVYKSTDFGGNWNMKNIGTGWLGNNVTQVTSQHNVEVSLANENIIWAGAAMTSDYGWNIFVSTDQGETYDAVSDFTDANLSGYISGIATDPYEDSTAYILFSFPGEPKVLKTKDLGQTWEDLSGFVGNTSSSNGFPDVVTHCLVVLPNDPSTIWVGTDIGLFESTDDGVSWHYADNGIPSVSIYDMFIQDGQVVVATHGRGIWTATIEELSFIPDLSGNYSGEQTISVIYELMSSVDSLELYLNTDYYNTIKNVSSGIDTMKVNVAEEGLYNIQAVSYSNGNAFNSNVTKVEADFKPIITDLSKASEDNTIDIVANLNENYDSLQITVNGERIKSETTLMLGENNFSVKYTESGSQVITLIGFISETGYESESSDIFLTYTGISGLNSVKSLKVYPNPTKGNITVELPQNFDSDYNLNVYSLSGAQVYSTRINKSENRINLYNLKDGLYIIRIENKGEIYSQKIQLRK